MYSILGTSEHKHSIVSGMDAVEGLYIENKRACSFNYDAAVGFQLGSSKPAHNVCFLLGSFNFGKYVAGPSLEHGYYAEISPPGAYVIGLYFRQSPLHILPVLVISFSYYA